jgi:hypothetical protein
MHLLWKPSIKLASTSYFNDLHRSLHNSRQIFRELHSYARAEFRVWYIININISQFSSFYKIIILLIHLKKSVTLPTPHTMQVLGGQGGYCSVTLDMTSDGLGENFLLVSMGGWAEGPACTDTHQGQQKYINISDTKMMPVTYLKICCIASVVFIGVALAIQSGELNKHKMINSYLSQIIFVD